MTVGSGEWTLPGTLTLPMGAGPVPALVLVHGSGPNDRDETIGPNKPFRDLAWGLASQGIAVLRYDKRTLVHGDKMVDQPVTVKEETIDDALAAAALLRSMPEIDPRRIFVLGHSLGGMLIPRIGAGDPALAGLIILAGATRPLEDAILDQYTYLFLLDGQISADEQKQLDTLRVQAARVKSTDLAASTPAADLPLGLPAVYWRDLRNYHPAEAARDLQHPLLILQGERDYQVTVQEDLAGWRAALTGKAGVTFKTYPKLNHLFLEGSDPSTPAEYDQAGHIPAYVIADLVAWIQHPAANNE